MGALRLRRGSLEEVGRDSPVQTSHRPGVTGAAPDGYPGLTWIFRPMPFANCSIAFG